MTSHFVKRWCKKKDNIEEEDELVPRVVKYASKGQLERMLHALDELREPVNSTDSYLHSALFYAALNGHKKCLKELLKRGANPNQ